MLFELGTNIRMMARILLDKKSNIRWSRHTTARGFSAPRKSNHLNVLNVWNQIYFDSSNCLTRFTTAGSISYNPFTIFSIPAPSTGLISSFAFSASVDLCMRSTISFDGAMILREQWEKQGKGKVLISPASWTWLSLSRDNPIFSDVRVRRALLHAIDRDAMVQNLFKGEKVVSHLPLSRVRKSYNKALAASTVYKYDPERAKQLLAEAGWKPGAEAVLTNAKGERLEFEFRVTAERRDHEQAQAVIADY